MGKYQVVTGNSVAELQDMVNWEIEHGWQPLGGVSAVIKQLFDGDPNENRIEEVEYMQAMVR